MQTMQETPKQTIPTNIMGSKMASMKVRTLEAKNAAAEQSIRTSIFVNVEDLFSNRVSLEEAIYISLTSWNFFDYMFEDGTLFAIRRYLPTRRHEGYITVHINREYNTESTKAFEQGQLLVRGDFNEGIEVCRKFYEYIQEFAKKLKEAVPVAG